jgi:microcystin-dependent protein
MGKIFGGSVDLQKIAAPSTPAAGYLKLYSKSDDKIYVKDSTGTESVVGPLTIGAGLALTGQTISIGVGAVDSNMITNGSVQLVDLAATGTKDDTTFLRGDNTWAVPPGTGGSGGPGIPTGAMMMWPTATAPTGWLLCDGAAIPAGNTALIALIGANTPDMRNKFPQGAGTGNALASVGGTAVTDIVNHTHTTPAHNHPYDVPSTGTSGTANAVIQRGSGTAAATITGGYNPATAGGGTTSNPVQTSVATGENRPPFLTVNYIIKT